jgi:TATA element modulatory factor
MTLQERLAASIARSHTGTPKISAGEDSGTITPVKSSSDLPQTGSNGLGKENGTASPIQLDTLQLPASPVRNETPASDIQDLPSRTETPDLPVIQGDIAAQDSLVTGEMAEELEITEPTRPPVSPILPIPDSSSPRPSSARLSTSFPPETDPATAELISQLRSDLATCESRRVEESQQASARIASLEQKLKILAETALQNSRELASNPTASSWERKLAEREEKIALLLDEGAKSEILK